MITLLYTFRQNDIWEIFCYAESRDRKIYESTFLAIVGLKRHIVILFSVGKA